MTLKTCRKLGGALDRWQKEHADKIALATEEPDENLRVIRWDTLALELSVELESAGLTFK